MDEGFGHQINKFPFLEQEFVSNSLSIIVLLQNFASVFPFTVSVNSVHLLSITTHNGLLSGLELAITEEIFRMAKY